MVFQTRRVFAALLCVSFKGLHEEERKGLYVLTNDDTIEGAAGAPPKVVLFFTFFNKPLNSFLPPKGVKKERALWRML